MKYFQLLCYTIFVGVCFFTIRGHEGDLIGLYILIMAWSSAIFFGVKEKIGYKSNTWLEPFNEKIPLLLNIIGLLILIYLFSIRWFALHV